MKKKEEIIKKEETVVVEPDKREEEIKELNIRWMRALADYQNLEKRYEREKEDFVQFANTNLILKLLSVLDHLEKAGEYLKDPGLDLAIKQFKNVLGEEYLEEIVVDKNGEFNPMEMEAVEIKEGEPRIEVITKGYRLKDKVIRPAKVIVIKNKK